jgi:hypothetical protein
MHKHEREIARAAHRTVKAERLQQRRAERLNGCVGHVSQIDPSGVENQPDDANGRAQRRS